MENNELFIELKKFNQNTDKEKYIEIRNKIIEKNLNLVLSRVCHIYGKRNEDLIEAGNEGLITAITKYDINRGTEFSTYAVYWIDQAIGREMQKEKNTLKIPVYKYERVRTAIKKLRTEKEEPSIKELSIETNIPEEELNQIINMLQQPISFNSTLNDGDTEISELIRSSDAPVEELIETKILSQDLNELLKLTLTKSQYIVITMRYGLYDGEERPLEEIGKILNITRERVRQIETKAIRKLRMNEKIKDFAVYMDKPDKCKKMQKMKNE